MVETTHRTIITTALIAFASALLPTAPSYSTEKVALACVGTMKTSKGANERTEGSLVISISQNFGPSAGFKRKAPQGCVYFLRGLDNRR